MNREIGTMVPLKYMFGRSSTVSVNSVPGWPIIRTGRIIKNKGGITASLDIL